MHSMKSLTPVLNRKYINFIPVADGCYTKSLHKSSVNG